MHECNYSCKVGVAYSGHVIDIVNQLVVCVAVVSLAAVWRTWCAAMCADGMCADGIRQFGDKGGMLSLEWLERPKKSA